jgi:hypothetical protein
MVAPNLVLTARHCVSRTDEGALCSAAGSIISGGRVVDDHAPGEIGIYRGKDAILLADDDMAATAHGKQLVIDESNTICNGDLAFIVLDRAINGPVASLRLSGGAREGEELTSVGWGLTEGGQLPRERQQRRGIPVLAAGPKTLDSATDIGLGDAEFLVGESICQGDSGGPAFSSKGALVGVVSRGGGGTGDPSNNASTCIGAGVLNIYTHLGGDPPGAGLGQLCSKDADCVSNVCGEGTCTILCGDGITCPSDQRCQPDGDRLFCVPATTRTAGDGANDPNPSEAAPAESSSDSGCTVSPGSVPASGGVVGSLVALAFAAVARRIRRCRTL